MKLGVHCSIGGGITNALKEAESLGCNTMQIFPGSPKIWNPIPFAQNEIEKFIALNQKYQIKPIFIHSVYLVNLASYNTYFYSQSKVQLIDSLKKAQLLGAAGCVTHLGSVIKISKKEGMKKVISAIDEILSQTQSDFIIENSAGAGQIIGDTFSEIGQIIKGCQNSKRIKVALDTAHAYAAGYELATEQGLEKTLTEFNQKIGLDKLVLIHTNDTAVERGSNLDRHANIGEGKIGFAGFARIINHPKLKHLPFLVLKPGVSNIKTKKI